MVVLDLAQITMGSGPLQAASSRSFRRPFCLLCSNAHVLDQSSESNPRPASRYHRATVRRWATLTVIKAAILIFCSAFLSWSTFDRSRARLAALWPSVAVGPPNERPPWSRTSSGRSGLLAILAWNRHNTDHRFCFELASRYFTISLSPTLRDLVDDS